MLRKMALKSLVSSGSNKFHLAPLASELERHGCLAGLIAAGWPMGWQRFIAEAFPESAPCKRFLDRWEPISTHKIYSSPFTEAVLQVGDIARKYSVKSQHNLYHFAFKQYAKHASTVVYKTRPSIYHFRSAYGGKSLSITRKLGIPAVCDHSIAHPNVAEYMVNNRGKMPPINESQSLTLLSKLMVNDMDNSDYLIVNSDFVKDTCIYAGYQSSRIYVVYWGVDNKFTSALPIHSCNICVRHEPRLLYAGGWQKRKGVETLIEAFIRLPSSVQIDIAGGIEPKLQTAAKHRDFFKLDNVHYLGIVPRAKLAELFSESSIFVFPSYCEGSARVIFEAMAAGCFIITTHNSGSIVKDGVHGSIVNPGDPEGLLYAIETALSSPDDVANIGAYNANLVRSSYTQAHYSSNILKVYAKIASSHIAHV